jgi:hypothetical protein
MLFDRNAEFVAQNQGVVFELCVNESLCDSVLVNSVYFQVGGD